MLGVLISYIVDSSLELDGKLSFLGNRKLFIENKSDSLLGSVV